MKKLEIIIRPEKVSLMKTILSEVGVTGATFVSVSGYGSEQCGQYLFNGEQQYEQIFSKTKVEVVVADEKVEPIIEMVTKRIATGKIGDGKIFVYNVEETVRVRTGERGLGSL